MNSIESLTFGVEDGQQFTVDRVIWHGTVAFGADQEMQLTSVHPGDVLDMSKVRETVEGVRRLYHSCGFAELQLSLMSKLWSRTGFRSISS